MWNLIVLIPNHCPSVYFLLSTGMSDMSNICPGLFEQMFVSSAPEGSTIWIKLA